MVSAVKTKAVKFQCSCAILEQKCSAKLKKLIRKVSRVAKEISDKISAFRHITKDTIKGTLHRVTTGPKFTAMFPMPPSHNPRLKFLMEKFTQYALTSQGYYDTRPINAEQEQKLKDLIERNDPDAVDMQMLLKRCRNPKFRRKDFDGHDVKCLDKATFELVKEMSYDLVEFFNMGHLNPLANGIKEQFGMKYYEAIIAEVLARSVAYDTHLDGKKMLLPVLKGDGTYGVAAFTIKLYYLGDELPAYVLECKDADGNDRYNPWFVVRGTETSRAKTKDGNKVRVGGSESILADTIHRDGVGEGVLDKCIDAERRICVNGKWTEQPSLRKLFADRQFKLSGHSLGGNIVNQLAAHLYDNVENAYGFNAPGVSDRIAKMWAAKSSPTGHKLFNIQPQSDPVPSAGKRLIGTHIALTHLMKPKNADFVHVHVLMSLTKPFELQLIDKELEEMQNSRIAVELLRNTIGVVVRGVMGKFKFTLPEWYINRDVFVVAPAA